LIEDRPKIVDLKQRFGDLEIDTIIGKNHKGAIVTINVEPLEYWGWKKIKAKESDLVKTSGNWIIRELEAICLQ
jgi:IS30 family transposase